MFTGLIEETGKVLSLQEDRSNLDLQISCSKILEDIKHGDSIAVNGVCLTVTQFDTESFSVTAIKETLDLTNLGNLKIDSQVNLERCLRLGDRLGGHIVQGHVDAVAEVTEIKDAHGSTEYFLQIKKELAPLIIHKGSIALNGISLTVASREVQKDGSLLISVAIIPETSRITNISEWQAGTKINVEVDMLGKYALQMHSSEK